MKGTPQSLDWIFGVVGILLSGAGVVLVVWALFRDRSRGRRRCPRCWYDLSGLPGLKCPECGEHAPSERALFRTRRRWNRVRLGVLLLAAAAIVASVPSYQRGWVSMVPGWVLVYVAPPKNEPPRSSSAFVVSARSRIAGRGALSGTFVPLPVATNLTIAERLTAEVWDRLNADRLPRWEAAAFIGRYLRSHQIEIADCVSVPERWRAGESIPVLARRPGEIAAGVTSTLGAVVSIGNTYGLRGEFELNPVPVGTRQLDVLVNLTVSGGIVVYARTLHLPCEIVPETAEIVAPDSSEETNSRMRTALRPYLSWDQKGRATIIAGDRSSNAEWAAVNMAIGFEVEISLDGAVLGTGSGVVEWRRAVWKDWQEIEPQWKPGGLEKADANRQLLKLQVRGVKIDAEEEYMRAPFRRTARWWAGMIELPATLGPEERQPVGAPR